MVAIKNDNQKEILQALSMDLLRASIGRQRNSNAMANRFIVEANKRISELDPMNNKELITKIKATLSSRSERQAEDLLMCSTLIRNRAT